MNTIPRVKDKWSHVTDVHKRQGSDPLVQTARGKLQTRRSRLNDQINREIRLRDGAENLFKATTNKKLKETVALELSYVNSNLQLLKEELADLNSSVQIYQNDCGTHCVPMLPLGLKETKEVDFKVPLQDFIQHNYHESGTLYYKEIGELSEIRQACRTPVRTDAGIQLLFEYYNQLYFVERRFFAGATSPNLFMEWYDSLTGVPSCQNSVSFEKGSILYNVGALYTQIGARQDRTTAEGIATAEENFLKAAGTFHYLRENFSNAPSMDMQTPTLEMLVQLMLAQAQECVFEKLTLNGVESGMEKHTATAQDAAKVAEMYCESYRLMTENVKDYVPPSWVSMAEVKSHYFSALAHFYAVTAVLDQPDSGDVELMQRLFLNIHLCMNGHDAGDTASPITKPPKSEDERNSLAKTHLCSSIRNVEEAMRIHGLSKQLRRIDTFHDLLKALHEKTLDRYADLEEEDVFTSDCMSVTKVKASDAHKVELILPDFERHKVDDLFHKLGPLAIFSARHQWSRPRAVELDRGPGQELGFSVRGDAPVIVTLVEDGGLAQKAGILTGDFVVGVNGVDVKWSKHDEVVELVKASGPQLRLSVITPLDEDFLSGTSKTQQQNGTGGHSPKEHGHYKKKEKEKSGSSIWTLKRRSRSKDKKAGKAVANGSTKSVGTK